VNIPSSVIASLLMAFSVGSAQTLVRPHPCLLYTHADIQQYRRRIAPSPADKAAFDDLLREAEKIL
jgi:hypothetical protein